MSRKIILIEAEKTIVRKKELILEKPVRSAENVNLPKQRVRFTTNDQILGSLMTIETNDIIKEEAYDHRKVTKLGMSLQSSEIKLDGAILLRVLNFKKVTFKRNRVMGGPENISRTAKEISILSLGYCYKP